MSRSIKISYYCLFQVYCIFQAIFYHYFCMIYPSVLLLIIPDMMLTSVCTLSLYNIYRSKYLVLDYSWYITNFNGYIGIRLPWSIQINIFNWFIYGMLSISEGTLTLYCHELFNYFALVYYWYLVNLRWYWIMLSCWSIPELCMIVSWYFGNIIWYFTLYHFYRST